MRLWFWGKQLIDVISWEYNGIVYTKENGTIWKCDCDKLNLGLERL